MTTPPRTPGPLTGVRVLDLSQVVSGPICGRMLADLGAEVVKVEPMEGDIIRRLHPQFGDDSMSVYFSWVNAGKRSIEVDLRDERRSPSTCVMREWPRWCVDSPSPATSCSRTSGPA